MFQNIKVIFISYRLDQKIKSCKFLRYVFQDTNVEIIITKGIWLYHEIQGNIFLLIDAASETSKTPSIKWSLNLSFFIIEWEWQGVRWGYLFVVDLSLLSHYKHSITIVHISNFLPSHHLFIITRIATSPRGIWGEERVEEHMWVLISCKNF